MESPIYDIWLVVFRHPSEKYEFVSWDDEIPCGKINFMFQTTNQIVEGTKYAALISSILM